MNREEIIQKLKEYKLDINEYIVISGAAMVLYGFKEETRDIDISTTLEYKKYLLDHFNCELENKESDAYMIDNILNFGINYYSEDKIFIDGIPTQKVEDIIKLKKFLNRDKDKKDLQLIYKKKKR